MPKLRPSSAARPLLSLVIAAAWAGVAGAVVVPDAAEPSLIVGEGNLGMFAYYDRASGDLRVGRCVDPGCATITTSVVDSGGDVGRYPSMAPATSGALGPVISYEDVTGNRLKLALCVDPACAAATTVVVATNLGYGHGSAVVIGNDGRPLVFYLQHRDFEAGVALVAHCDDAACTAVTTTALGPGDAGLGIDAVLTSDGFATAAWTASTVLGGSNVVGRHCANQACSILAADGFGGGSSSSSRTRFPALALRPGGLPSVAFPERFAFGGPLGPRALLYRCGSFGCSSLISSQAFADAADEPLDVTVGNDDRARLVVRQEFGDGLDFVQCADADCTAAEQTCLTGRGQRPSVVVLGGAQPLAAFEIDGAVAVQPPAGSCGAVLTVQGATRVEGDGGPLVFTVRLGPAQPGPVTVQYATADGTASAGADYVAATGTITFPPGATVETVAVTILPDGLDETDETFTVSLSAPASAGIALGSATGTIVDDDTVPSVDALDCAVVEGTTGTTPCPFEVRLSAPYPETVTVQYATAPGTASTGTDFEAASGTLTFAAGTTSGTVPVSVKGDVTPEADEVFTLALASPTNATLGDTSADGVIVDDDGTPAGDRELVHGSSVVADLAPGAGPTPDQDDYRLAQAPYASYEVVLDAASGDAAPEVHLDRIASDGSTVLQSSDTVGTGTARSLRFQNRLGVPLVGQSIRVGSAACGTACGGDDVYRLRAYETTASIPRFNDSGSQVTVLVLQNRTDRPVSANADFWDASGTRRAVRAITLEPHGTLALNTATVPGLAGVSGSVTVSHDGPYGALAGKAVALEPATGSSFDSMLGYRPR